MPDVPAPVHISPLIKFFRYAFLIAGIFYGAGKLKALRAYEESRTDEKARKRAERAAKLAEEKQLAAERDFQQIVEIFRPPPRAVDPVVPVSVDPQLNPEGFFASEQANIVGLRPPCDSELEALYEDDGSRDILEKPLDLTEKEEPEGYVIKDFDQAPILPPEDKDCRLPPKV